jgi:hypothetical protein
MRIVRFALTSALLLSGLLAVPRAFAARAAAQSASGSYQFTAGDHYLKYVKFDAQALGGGGATGSLFFSDEAEVTYTDLDTVGAPVETHKGYYLKAEVDGLLVNGNRAVVCGKVTDASIASLVGRRVLLAVEDNGDNSKEPDRLTWGVYLPTDKGWTPSDAELERDPGVGASWWATDAELKDDAGRAMPGDETISAKTFALPAYAFAETDDAAGDILVQP